MRDPIADSIKSLKPSGIRRFFDAVSSMGGNVVSLCIGEPDFDTPMHVRNAGIESLKRGKTHYTANSGLAELRSEISSYMSRRFGLDYSPTEEIIVTVGGSEGIDLTMRVMLNPGDEVIIPQPSFVAYGPLALMAGGVPVYLPLEEKDQFRLTPEKLLSAITPKTKLLVLPFPSNPTGGVMLREDLKAISPIILEHDLFVLSDEIYSELVYGRERHISIAELPGMKERTVIINGFSKSFAMTGWRLGYTCAPPNITRQLLKMHQYALMSSPTTSQYAAIEALRNGDGDIAEMRNAYNERRRFIMAQIEKIGLPCFEPLGAFYVFPCIKEFGLTSEEFAQLLLEKKGVAVVPGTAFGDCGEGYLRISYAYSLASLKKAFEKIREFVEELRNK